MAELKPCCDVPPIVGELNLTGPSVIITCPKCNRKIWKHSKVHGKDYYEQAIAAWNKRSDK